MLNCKQDQIKGLNLKFQKKKMSLKCIDQSNNIRVMMFALSITALFDKLKKIMLHRVHENSLKCMHVISIDYYM